MPISPSFGLSQQNGMMGMAFMAMTGIVFHPCFLAATGSALPTDWMPKMVIVMPRIPLS